MTAVHLCGRQRIMSSFMRPYFYFFLYVLFQNMVHIQGSVIHAQSDEYKNKVILCDKSEDCAIYCRNPNSCQYAHIECPIDSECNITCSGAAACQHITINATHASLFTLNDCDTGNDYTCSGLSIYFPPNLNGKQRGILHVGNHFNSKSNEMEFYAINGWRDIDATSSFGIEQDTIQGIMHCTPDYKSQCIFAVHDWTCNNPNALCNNYTSPAVITNEIEEEISSNEYVQESDAQPDIARVALAILSSLNQIWYIIGTIVAFLCCFLCILLCLIRRSYRLHHEAATGLKTAHTELAAFRMIHEAMPYNYANSPYHNSIPMSSHIGTPIPKSKNPSTATSLDIEELYEQDESRKKQNLTLYPPTHWLPDTPLNSVQTALNSSQQPIKRYHVPQHHNPPSIMSVSTPTELGLQPQQMYRLASLQQAAHVRVPSPSFKSVNTHNTMNTFMSNGNQTIQTFVVVETPNRESEDEFIDYQHAYAPDHIYNRSLTATTMSHKKQIPSAISSSMPLSVNSPSTSAVTVSHDPPVSKGRTLQVLGKSRGNIARIPRFDSIKPLPETGTTVTRHLNAFLGRRKETNDTVSSTTNPFASTARSGSGSTTTLSTANSSSRSSTTSSDESSSEDESYDDEEMILRQKMNNQMNSKAHSM
eukprot:606298_1